MVAIPLLMGRLTAEDYTDAVAADPRIDALRARMEVTENPRFTLDYFDPDKRYIGNSVEVVFRDGSSTGKVSVDVPIGHRERRGEGVPVLLRKFEAAVRGQLPARKVDQLLALTGDTSRFEATPIHRFIDLFTL
jgi:2-methylcitrate dehydratase